MLKWFKCSINIGIDIKKTADESVQWLERYKHCKGVTTAGCPTVGLMLRFVYSVKGFARSLRLLVIII